MAASVWMKSTYGPASMSRAMAETMPRVTVPPRPKGLPTAITSSPTRTWSLSPSASSGRSFGVDLQEREVGLLVGADHLGVELAVVGEAHLHRLGLVHHVVVGDDVAVALHHEARAERHAVPMALRPALIRRRRDRALGQAEAAEELLEGRALAEGRPLGAHPRHLVVVLGGEHRHHRRAGPLDQVGDGVRRLGHRLRRRGRPSAPASGVQAIQAPAVAASAVVLSKVAMRVMSGNLSSARCHALAGRRVARQDRTRT